MNWMKRTATLAWAIAFGYPAICCALAQAATSQPLLVSGASAPASQPSVAAHSTVTSLPTIANATAAPPAAQANVPVAVKLTNWPSHESTFALDIVKAAIGAFLGAGLAFFSSYLQRRSHSRKENIAAGNLALFNIRGVSKSMSEMRLSMRSDVEGHRGIDKNMPIWALGRVWIYKPVEDVSFDYDSLTFLLDTEGGRKAVLHLRYVEEIYKETYHIYEMCQEIAKQYRAKFATTIDLHMTAQGVIDWTQFGFAIGDALMSDRESYFQAMLHSTEVDIVEIQIAFDLLMNELKGRFEGDTWQLDFFPPSTSNRHESKLPEFPDDIEAFLRVRREAHARGRAASVTSGA